MRAVHPAFAFFFTFALIFAGCGGGSDSCTSARDCVEGQECVGGSCRALVDPGKKCTGDENCGAGEFCDLDSRCKKRVGTDAAPKSDATSSDAQPDSDAHSQDALAGDAASPDAMGADAFPADRQEPDATVALDAQAADAAADAGLTEDARPSDAARPDASSTDAGFAQDASASDASAPADTGPADAGGSCNLDSQCGSADLICVSNACVLRCNRPGAASCGGTSVCNPDSGRCVPGSLPLGDDCGIDAQCQSRMCLGLSISASSHSTCTTPCGAGSDCPLNFSCTYVSGTSFCLPERVFTPVGVFDVRAGGACSSASIQCQTGWCNTQANVCLETCTREADCASFGGSCWTYTQSDVNGTTYDHLCLAQTGSAVGIACTVNSNCASGVCDRYNSRCAAHCCADADCPLGQNCSVYDLDTTTGALSKICAPKEAASGSKTVGTSCAASSECDSEICAPVNGAIPSGPKQCSTLCCRNSDCAALPNGRCDLFGGPTIGTTDTIIGVCVNG